MVVSDHGMTYNGNHGGSSFEETDSLALFIGLRNHVSDYALYTLNTVYQVIKLLNFRLHLDYFFVYFYVEDIKFR